MHLAVGRSVGIALEARLADGAVGGDKPGHSVSRTTESGDRDQRVRGRTGAASGRLGMTGEALVGIEARPQSVVLAALCGLDLREPGHPVTKERCFVRGQPL